MHVILDCFHALLLNHYSLAGIFAPPGKPASSITFSDDLSIYRSDIRKDNFLYDISTGDIWIIDLRHIDVLSKPFQTSISAVLLAPPSADTLVISRLIFPTR